ncbi:spindle and kinetochore-associated protein 2-like [Physella acuta]|uniref:spindle and kinetochore-associated protein 2-like n=1 Tax=Physella acuta TaxID=109671 RepID=UPI0027DCDB80|nr:spindle and kinetochore-associated protein 2-like [Physella acuta]XP_059139071.1 spindle and kinetochore-associated protein 2-like [Physella acuta]
MEKAVDRLESLFQKAEADLNFISRKLDFQLENEQGVNTKNNPVRLLKAIEEVKTEYSSLVEDMSAIQQAQKETVAFFRTQLLTMTQMLEKLENQTGVNPEMTEATVSMFEELSQLMGIPKDDLLPSEEQNQEDSKTCASNDPGTTASSASSQQPATTNQTDFQQTKVTVPTPFERRQNSSEFQELDQEEFMSVSELIRARAKFEDVNRTYRLLWQHFKEEGNTKALTPKEMNTMGLRVTGATGDAKLKILRALKLAQISKTGEVKLT